MHFISWLYLDMTTKLILTGTRSNQTQFDGFSPLWLSLSTSLDFSRFEYTGTEQVSGYNYPLRTHTQTRPECRKLIYYPFYINRNSNPKSFYSHSQSLSLLDDTNLSYNFFFLLYLALSASLFSFTIVIDHCHLFIV